MTKENQNNDSSIVMTAREVCELLRLPLSTLYDLAVSGRLRAVKCGRQWRFLKSDVINYLHGISARHSFESQQERRQSARIKSKINARFTNGLDEAEALEGIICDLSEGGVFFELSDDSKFTSQDQGGAIGVGHPVEMVFELDLPRKVNLNVKGRIVRVNQNSCCEYAVKFRHLSDEDQGRIRDYVG